MSDNRLSGIKETIDDSIEDFGGGGSSFFIEPITSVQDNTDLSGGNAGYGGL